MTCCTEGISAAEMYIVHVSHYSIGYYFPLNIFYPTFSCSCKTCPKLLFETLKSHFYLRISSYTGIVYIPSVHTILYLESDAPK